ncbi:MAG: hypothetical protein MI864_09465 [Pseudomonadales bacterium]|nr:hypothetical protein [Pseudomonadales bacterium]
MSHPADPIFVYESPSLFLAKLDGEAIRQEMKHPSIVKNGIFLSFAARISVFYAICDSFLIVSNSVLNESENETHRSKSLRPGKQEMSHPLLTDQITFTIKRAYFSQAEVGMKTSKATRKSVLSGTYLLLCQYLYSIYLAHY